MWEPFLSFPVCVLSYFCAVTKCFRHSLEYIEREDMIVAHMVGDVDALIKLPQGWPLSDLPMELKSLMSTSQHSKEVSFSLPSKIMVSGGVLK